jgi:hypothetical protein
MRRSLIAACALAACAAPPAQGPPLVPEAPPGSGDPAAALWGAWALDPDGHPGAEVRALGDGPAARALAALPPSLPAQARARGAIDALAAPVLIVTPDQLFAATDAAPIAATWTLKPLGDGRSLLSTERLPAADAASAGPPAQHRAIVRLRDADHLQLEPAPGGAAVDLVRVPAPR